MKLLRFLLLTTLAGGANTCFVPAAQAQAGTSIYAARQLVADWKARDASHDFACLYAHRENVTVIAIDSVGPTGSVREMYCAQAGGVVRFVAEKPDEQEAMQAIEIAMAHNPAWLVGVEVYGILKGEACGPDVPECAVGVVVVRKAEITP